ncbi:hypothetical protein C8C83_0624 [Flavobacterium sp. 90]|nr:hypothetical protein C8C82_0920 [Flavobacterium sp. 81]TCK52810.1 hypothetical protein C8C83_0624 [Flavobacterium sp. 90]
MLFKYFELDPYFILLPILLITDTDLIKLILYFFQPEIDNTFTLIQAAIYNRINKLSMPKGEQLNLWMIDCLSKMACIQPKVVEQIIRE